LFPDTTERLGDGCFSGCESLEAVDFGAGSRLVAIGTGAFRGSSVRRLAVPDGVECLYNKYLYECQLLEAVDFGAGSRLVEIGSMRFVRARCSVLRPRTGLDAWATGAFVSANRWRRSTSARVRDLSRSRAGCWPVPGYSASG